MTMTVTKVDKKVPEEKVEVVEEQPIDLAEVINGLMPMAKDIFKKKESNPDICEISIKAPSEVILKLFGKE